MDELDGIVPSARISALSGLGCDDLEDKLTKMGEELRLFEDQQSDA